jgi:hypothetical protein
MTDVSDLKAPTYEYRNTNTGMRVHPNKVGPLRSDSHHLMKRHFQAVVDNNRRVGPEGTDLRIPKH